MDHRRLFGNRRTRRRRRTLLNRADGEMIDLLQLMRRRLRYRPYFINNFRNHSRDRNLTDLDNYIGGNMDLYHNALYRQMSNPFVNIERQNVSTNTEYPCCPASVLHNNQNDEFEFSSEAETNLDAPEIFENQECSAEIVRSQEILESTAENIRSQNAVAESKAEQVRQVNINDSNVATQSPATVFEYDAGVESQDRVEIIDSNITFNDFSYNIDEHNQSFNNSSHSIMQNTTKESLITNVASQSSASSLESMLDEDQNQAKAIDSNTDSTDEHDQKYNSSHSVIQNTLEESLITKTNVATQGPASSSEYMGDKKQAKVKNINSKTASSDLSSNIDEHDHNSYHSVIHNTSEESLVTTPNIAIKSPALSLEYMVDERQNQFEAIDSNTTVIELSSNTDEHDQTYSSSHSIIPNTSEESLITTTPPTIAYIQVHYSSAQEQNSGANDSITNFETHSPSSLSIDTMAGGDGHHNNNLVLELEITLSSSLVNMEANSQENLGEGDHDDNNAASRINMHEEEVEEEHNDEFNRDV